MVILQQRDILWVSFYWGDILFGEHGMQCIYIYIHDIHTIKINGIIC